MDETNAPLTQEEIDELKNDDTVAELARCLRYAAESLERANRPAPALKITITSRDAEKKCFWISYEHNGKPIMGCAKDTAEGCLEEIASQREWLKSMGVDF